MPPSHLTEIVQGIADIDKLQTCDAVLSGYLGSAEQGEHILGIVRQVKAANPAAKYFCDPVMGHPEKGCIVAPGVAEFHVRYALPASDIIAPNLVELEILCGHPVASVSEAVAAARELIAQGPEVVLVKHLARAGLSMDRFEMLLVMAEEAWHISRPLVDFGLRQPVGVGDVTSGLLLVKLLQGASLRDALEHVTAAVYEIMLATKNMQEYELQVVAAQDRIAVPGAPLQRHPAVTPRACPTVRRAGSGLILSLQPPVRPPPPDALPPASSSCRYDHRQPYPVL